jgi:hypothetical protein
VEEEIFIDYRFASLVGNVIRGRILLNDDANQADPIPADCQLFLRLESISETDTFGMISNRISNSNSNQCFTSSVLQIVSTH